MALHVNSPEVNVLIKQFIRDLEQKYPHIQTTASKFHLIIPSSNRRKKYNPRPQNSFILFRKDFIACWRKNVMSHVPKNPDTREFSKMASKAWRELSQLDKYFWDELAAVAKYIHAQIFPNYKYKPRQRGSNIVDVLPVQQIDHVTKMKSNFHDYRWFNLGPVTHNCPPSVRGIYAISSTSTDNPNSSDLIDDVLPVHEIDDVKKIKDNFHDYGWVHLRPVSHNCRSSAIASTSTYTHNSAYFLDQIVTSDRSIMSWVDTAFFDQSGHNWTEVEAQSSQRFPSIIDEIFESVVEFK